MRDNLEWDMSVSDEDSVDSFEDSLRIDLSGRSVGRSGWRRDS